MGDTSMAKKIKEAPKKRESKGAAPKAEEGKVLGTVSIPVQVSVFTGDNTSGFNEMVIEWSCLGLAEEPDKIQALSNTEILDPARPITTSEEGLHLYFRSRQTGGNYGFQLLFTYNDAIEARTAAPEDKAADEQEAA
jgi:hypothetical protein